jgi:hypothetical protein
LGNGAKKKLHIIANSKNELPSEWHKSFKPIYQTTEGDYAMKEDRKWITFFVPEL